MVPDFFGWLEHNYLFDADTFNLSMLIFLLEINIKIVVFLPMLTPLKLVVLS